MTADGNSNSNTFYHKNGGDTIKNVSNDEPQHVDEESNDNEGDKNDLQILMRDEVGGTVAAAECHMPTGSTSINKTTSNTNTSDIEIGTTTPTTTTNNNNKFGTIFSTATDTSTADKNNNDTNKNVIASHNSDNDNINDHNKNNYINDNIHQSNNNDNNINNNNDNHNNNLGIHMRQHKNVSSENVPSPYITHNPIPTSTQTSQPYTYAHLHNHNPPSYECHSPSSPTAQSPSLLFHNIENMKRFFAFMIAFSIFLLTLEAKKMRSEIRQTTNGNNNIQSPTYNYNAKYNDASHESLSHHPLPWHDNHLFDDDQPIMYTFYQPVTGTPREPDTLEYWKTSWSSIGFQTRILDLSSFENHPDAEAIRKFVKSKVIANDDYNLYCFYRWFAMATMEGGGWMSDYDTYPANFPMEYSHTDNLPNNGQFTSFQSFVPALMVGSSKEWERVARLVLQSIEDIPDTDPITDMHAFYQVLFKNDHNQNSNNNNNNNDHNIIFYNNEGDNYNTKAKILEGFHYKLPHKVDCNAMEGVWGLHLSFNSSVVTNESGLWPIRWIATDRIERGVAAGVFFSEWRYQCGLTTPLPLDTVEQQSHSNIINSGGNDNGSHEAVLPGNIEIINVNNNALENEIYNQIITENASQGLNSPMKTLLNTPNKDSNNIHANVMYTFYQQVSGKPSEPDTLEYWKASWESIGFQTRILDLSDFENHPDAERVRNVVKSFVEIDVEYNYYCFYRWFAMATIPGGGWMSDYDTYPANFPMEYASKNNLPNAGRFTTFQSFIPALMVGSSEEWGRVAEFVLQAIHDIPDGEIITDMLAFYQVLTHEERNNNEYGIFYHWNDCFNTEPNVKVKSGLQYLEPHKVDCKAMEGVWALHLNFNSSVTTYEAGNWPIEWTALHKVERGVAANVYFSEWRNQCGFTHPISIDSINISPP